MTKNDSSPFFALKLNISQKEQNQKKQGAMLLENLTQGTKKETMADYFEPETPEDDSNLFLSAMASVTPKSMHQKKKEKRPDTYPLAEKLVKNRADNTAKTVPQLEKLTKENSFSTNTLENKEVAPTCDEILFAKAMAEVSPVAAKGRDIIKSGPRNILPFAHSAANSIHETLEGRIEFSFHNKDQYIEGHVMGVDPVAIHRLRAGEFSPEAHIDLHGLNANQAYDALISFVKNAYQQNMRTVLVITGKGKNSPQGISIIKNFLQIWLTKEPFKRVVLAFCSAQNHDGGTGAAYVMLRKYKKNRGKIRWNIPHQNFDSL